MLEADSLNDSVGFQQLNAGVNIPMNESDKDGMDISSQETIHSEANKHTKDKVVATDNGQQKSNKVFNLNNIHLYGESFYVFLESTDDKNVGRLHPMYVGHILLKKLKIANIISINSTGRNRIKVSMKSAFDVNNLINNKQLEAEHLRAFVPSYLVERKGIIRGVDTRFDESYVKDNLESYSPILDIKRMHRKTVVDGSDKYIPRQMIIITFEGNLLPQYVTINSVQFSVEPFVGRVVQCFNCLQYGHISKQCKSTKALCSKCSKEKTGEHTCEAKDTYCLFCKSKTHSSTSKECSNYTKQKNIKEYMAAHNLPFLEAKKKIQASFSNVITSQNKFEVLGNLNNEIEFPPLPKARNYKCPNISMSQPPHPSTSYPRQLLTNHQNKKRKTVSSPVPQPSSENIFSFRMGPSNPLPPNPYRPVVSHIEEISTKISEFLSSCLSSLSKNISSFEEFKQIEKFNFKTEINRILEGILKTNI